MEFTSLLESVRARSDPEGWKPPGRLLAIDPGETTGWAFFVDGAYERTGEVGPEDTMLGLVEVIQDLNPDIVVVEDYRIYGWKARSHVGSDLFTPRLIGAIELACAWEDVPLYKQMAQTAKSFCTNKKLKEWGFYNAGSPHVRDSVRHACYWLVFNKEYKPEEG